MAYQGEVRRGAPALQRLCARRRGPGPAGASSARNAPSIEGRVSAMRLSGQRRLRQARRPSSVAGSGVSRRRFRLVRPVVRRACCAPCACLAWRLERSSASRAGPNSFKASVTASRAAEAAVAWGTLDDCFAACELPQQHQFGTLCEPILRKTVIQGPSQTRKDLAHFPTFT